MASKYSPVLRTAVYYFRKRLNKYRYAKRRLLYGNGSPSSTRKKSRSQSSSKGTEISRLGPGEMGEGMLSTSAEEEAN